MFKATRGKIELEPSKLVQSTSVGFIQSLPVYKSPLPNGSRSLPVCPNGLKGTLLILAMDIIQGAWLIGAPCQGAESLLGVAHSGCWAPPAPNDAASVAPRLETKGLEASKGLKNTSSSGKSCKVPFTHASQNRLVYRDPPKSAGAGNCLTTQM